MASMVFYNFRSFVVITFIGLCISGCSTKHNVANSPSCSSSEKGCLVDEDEGAKILALPQSEIADKILTGSHSGQYHTAPHMGRPEYGPAKIEIEKKPNRYFPWFYTVVFRFQYGSWESKEAYECEVTAQNLLKCGRVELRLYRRNDGTVLLAANKVDVGDESSEDAHWMDYTFKLGNFTRLSLTTLAD